MYRIDSPAQIVWLISLHASMPILNYFGYNVSDAAGMGRFVAIDKEISVDLQTAEV